MTSKSSIDDLAIFGGTPAFAEKLHVGRPNLGDREGLLRRLDDILDRRWLTNKGPYVQEFEREIEKLHGVAHCIATCNGTVALEIAIRAMGMTGEAIVPAFTFVATAHALQWQQIEPVFCDVDPVRCTLDPDAVARAITPRTSGIVGVHLWGRACDVQGLQAVADAHGLPLLFDASHALGCSSGGKMIGGFGRAEVFSFHATKVLNTFEGGAIVTDDDELAARIRLMKNFGFSGLDNVVYVGTNGKMNEIAAAMGLTGLETLDRTISVNHDHYERYGAGLRSVPGVELITYDEGEQNNYHYVVLQIDEAQAGLSRDELMAVLHAENVVARRYFYPGCHRMEPYRSLYPADRFELPETEKLAQRVLCLPTGTAVGPADVERVCDLISFAVGHAGEIRGRGKDALRP